MKYFYLDFHSDFCKHQHPDGVDYCEQNPVHFLLFVKNKFILIDYHCCMNGGDHIEWKKQMIDSLIKNSKIFPKYELGKSIRVKEELKDFRLRNQHLRKWVYQVHYLYGSNNYTEYCIASKVKYMDALCDAEEIEKNFDEAREYLSKYKNPSLIKELERLYFANPVWDIDEIEICKTVDHIVDSINKLII